MAKHGIKCHMKINKMKSFHVVHDFTESLTHSSKNSIVESSFRRAAIWQYLTKRQFRSEGITVYLNECEGM